MTETASRPARAGRSVTEPTTDPAELRERARSAEIDVPAEASMSDSGEGTGEADRGSEVQGRGLRPAVGARLEPTLDTLSRPDRGGGKIPHPPADALAGIPAEQRRSRPLALPELNEPEVVRHFVNLSHLNYAIDTGFYPLGSCTMKFNPKLNEWAARLHGFADLHPLAPEEAAQGTLELLWDLERMLAAISGMKAVTLQPAAGAHGELTGILMVRAYHASRGDTERREVIVPDSSHGTNPATASMAGFRTVTVRSDERGGVDLQALRAALGPQTAAVMITNPSTLGLFEERIVELLDAVHVAGALAYMDGANLNAVLGRFKPGEAGFDVMHFNVHKTFSTPHGGGGPGAGPVGVGERLEPFLPGPRVLRETDGTFRLEREGERPSSIGRVRAYQGNVGVLVRAYAYLRAHGGPGLAEVTNDAVLAANYLKHRIGSAYEIPFDRPCKHEFVASARRLKAETGVRTLDVAKRLIDHGFHPPTVYFPLIVDEALLIEPTETESLETLDAFAEALLAIAEEARRDPGQVKAAPVTAPVRRLDEAGAARRPDLRWRPMTGGETPCPD
jgi:glycine dehydrogenase subunit 2